ncbi:eukaryotic porin/Tom40 [Auriculariales sp. MPI-PUGE-AT-0066]|nr:eukaryotic porin/Tom40 [Auriculariales sp. MPI-PUGE-AT-0066]
MDSAPSSSTAAASLQLPNPGTVENLQKEVKNVHLTNYFFDGARADLNKTLSASPFFQVTHSFALASPTALPSYTFGAVYAKEDKHLLQGSVDYQGNVNARLNHYWAPANVTKFQAQLSQQDGHNMIQMEHDYQGRDFSFNARSINPSPTDLAGIYMTSWLQSVTKSLAFGTEALYQRSAGQSEMNLSYLVKYTSGQRDWIGTAQFQPTGLLMATYWQRLSEKVEVAAELQLVAARSAQRRSAVATLGAKYELRMSTFRAQLDSTGKVSALLEQRFAPSFAFLFAGEIDHFKPSLSTERSKVGVGVMIESSSLMPEEMGQPSPYA